MTHDYEAQYKHNNAVELGMTRVTHKDEMYLFHGYMVYLGDTAGDKESILLRVADALLKRLDSARRALSDIESWTDELEDEWDDIGTRAYEALKQTK